ncbi:MAG TPA: MEDS domain-containing protein [Nitrolancea sp.]|nr:MEDS domain-containing protein [Nitrolancea sp.]
MTEKAAETLTPVSFAGGVLDPFRHVCAFVNSHDERYRVLDPFVREGVERGERLMFFVDPTDRAHLISHHRQLGIDTPELLRQGQCVMRTWAETYLRDGHFDPNAMFNLLDTFFGHATAPRIRLITDMGWAAEEPNVSQLLLEYEAMAGVVQPKYPHISICVYDTAKFSGDILIDVLRTHPMALIGGMLQVNPFFVPAAEFLEELRSRDRVAGHG